MCADPQALRSRLHLGDSTARKRERATSIRDGDRIDVGLGRLSPHQHRCDTATYAAHRILLGRERGKGRSQHVGKSRGIPGAPRGSSRARDHATILTLGPPIQISAPAAITRGHRGCALYWAAWSWSARLRRTVLFQ